jgi:hypothetical protein
MIIFRGTKPRDIRNVNTLFKERRIFELKQKME